MTTEAHLLTLQQWLSPAFPVGAFAYAHGLEAAVQDGRLPDAEALRDWLEDVLEDGAGRSDAILLRLAWAAEGPEALAALDAEARALAPSAGRLKETALQGAAFATAMRDVWGHDLSDITYPVALGAAAKAEGIAAPLTATLYLQAFAGNLVSAAIRLGVTGQTGGQRLLAGLSPLCQSVAAEAGAATLDDIRSQAYLSDIASMRHDTLHSRIFRT